MAKQSFTTGSVLTAAQMNALQANDYNWTVSQKTASYVLAAADAGTRIEMNSGSATTVTVNTGLFTAGDTLFIQNIGSGVCTITAGTATVQKASNASLALAQYQGGYLYFISASNAVFFADAGFTSPLTTKGDLFTWDTGNARLPVGTNGQALLADSTTATGLKWGSAASTPNFSLIGTGTTSSGTTVTVSGISNVNTIMILLRAVTNTTAGIDLTMRLNGDTGSNYIATRTAVSLESTYSPNSQVSSNNTAGTSIFVTSHATGTTTGNAISGYILIQGCNSSGSKMIAYNAASGISSGWTSIRSVTGGGLYSGTGTISSFSLIASGGAFSGGTYEVWGSI